MALAALSAIEETIDHAEGLFGSCVDLFGQFNKANKGFRTPW